MKGGSEMLRTRVFQVSDSCNGLSLDWDWNLNMELINFFLYTFTHNRFIRLNTAVSAFYVTWYMTSLVRCGIFYFYLWHLLQYSNEVWIWEHCQFLIFWFRMLNFYQGILVVVGLNTFYNVFLGPVILLIIHGVVLLLALFLIRK